MMIQRQNIFDCFVIFTWLYEVLLLLLMEKFGIERSRDQPDHFGRAEPYALSRVAQADKTLCKLKEF